MLRRRSVLLMMLWSVAGVPVLVAQDFYEQQFQTGRSNLASGKNLEASTHLRIAAFGLLDRPPLLTETLVHLAVAQSALGHSDDASETVARFVTVEQRFPSYASLQLEPRIAAAFEALVLKVTPLPTIAATPSLSRLVRTEVQKVADLPVARRMAAYEAGFRKDPRNIQWPLAAAREAVTRDAFGEMIEWGLRALSLDRNNKEAQAILVRARTAKRECRESLSLLARFSVQELDARPDLYADQVVCLAETGRVEEAAALMARVPERLRGRMDVAAAAKRIDEAKRPVRSVAAALQPAPQPQPPPAVTPQPKPSNTAAQTPAAQPKTPVVTTPVPPPVVRPAVVPQSKTPTRTPAPAAVSQTRSADDVLASARLLVKQRKFADAVRELKAAVTIDGTSRAMRLALLEAAALAKDWASANDQIRVLTPLARGEELYMFYASMTMYETGRHEDAKPLMERALPRIVASPLVDYYAKAVLGRS
jgi:hypothetical protein